MMRNARWHFWPNELKYREMDGEGSNFERIYIYIDLHFPQKARQWKGSSESRESQCSFLKLVVFFVKALA